MGLGVGFSGSYKNKTQTRVKEKKSKGQGLRNPGALLQPRPSNAGWAASSGIPEVAWRCPARVRPMLACRSSQDFADGRVRLSGMARCSGTARTSLGRGPPWAWKGPPGQHWPSHPPPGPCTSSSGVAPSWGRGPAPQGSAGRWAGEGGGQARVLGLPSSPGRTCWVSFLHSWVTG